MCTVTLRTSEGGFLLTMNRDERRARGPEVPPAIRRADSGIEWLAPLDSVSGGTWIGVNDRGVAACLLNAYRPGDAVRDPATGRGRSRGRIIPALLVEGSPGRVEKWLDDKLDPSGHPSFTLIVVLGPKVRTFFWPGEGGMLQELSSGEGEWRYWSSSSWKTEEVLYWRQERFKEWLGMGAPFVGHLPALHLLQPRGLAQWSPLMAREQTATRSITQLECRPGGDAILRHWPFPEVVYTPPETLIGLPLLPAG